MVSKKVSAIKGRLPRFRFVGEIIGELKKVTWPTRDEALRLTFMVLVVCAAVGVILALLDYGFGRLVQDVFLK